MSHLLFIRKMDSRKREDAEELMDSTLTAGAAVRATVLVQSGEEEGKEKSASSVITWLNFRMIVF